MEKKIKSILINLITGDAFGSALEGLSKGHIKSLTYTKNLIEGFIEPDRTIVKNMKWRKPGLYTSVSQFTLLTALSMGRKNFNREVFLKNVRNSVELEELDFGIFRHPGPAEKYLLKKTKDRNISSVNCVIPSARILSSSIPLVFSHKGKFPDIHDILSFSTIFTYDSLTTAGLLIFTALVKSFLMENEEIKDIKNTSREITQKIRKHIDENSPLLFEQGLNPLNTLKDIDRYLNILETIEGHDKNDEVEKIICAELNKTLKTPVKRASIDNPLALLPYSIHIVANNRNPETVSMEAAMEGGAASSIGSIAGVLAASVYGCSAVNDILIKNIENRKRILKITDSIANMNIKKDLIDEFILSEASLTRNEISEYSSKVKNLKQKQKKNLTRRDKENRLTDHVVESWTKTDKAKWKKQKKKFEKQKQKNK